MSMVQARGTAAPPAPGGSPQAGDPLAPARPAGGTGRLAGLDGLRALAIMAVLVFHLDPTWLPGGFLGVDIFFVVSGFLITTLLVRERVASGRIDLPGFWSRRARRLIPALLVCVPAAVLLARLSEGDLLVGIGRQVLGAATFTSNWLEIHAGTDYFAATSPQLLMNLWSLAVEEQFYLLWPLAVLGLLAVTRRPEARAGAALAFAYAAPHRAWTTSAWWAAHRRQVAVAALGTLLGLMALIGEDSALTFRGGILLACVATTALVLVVVERPGRLRAVLELPAARWVGARSYGIYLWHWPVFLVIGSDLPVAPGGTTYLLTRAWCVVVTFVIADLSYRFVETPVRRHGFAGTARLVTGRLRRVGPRGARAVWSVALVLAVALVAVLLTAPERVDVWTVPDAAHTGGLAAAPVQWRQRVLAFLDQARRLAPRAVRLRVDPHLGQVVAHRVDRPDQHRVAERVDLAALGHAPVGLDRRHLRGGPRARGRGGRRCRRVGELGRGELALVCGDEVLG